jgi:hypothetical protein
MIVVFIKQSGAAHMVRVGRRYYIYVVTLEGIAHGIGDDDPRARKSAGIYINTISADRLTGETIDRIASPLSKRRALAKWAANIELTDGPQGR